MSTSPVRISLVGAVLAAALAINGCNDETNYEGNISKFDANSGHVDSTGWNIPKENINSYEAVAEFSSHSDEFPGISEKSDVYRWYESNRQVSLNGNADNLQQAIAAVS